MVSRIGGGQVLYDNMKYGWAINPDEDDDGRILMVCTDTDNEEVHLFPMPVKMMDQFFQMGKQTSAKIKIEVAGANEMPRPT